MTELFTKTTKEVPGDETSKNAQLLIKAGYIYKNMAGAYVFLPLGLRVLNKINEIIRQEMNNAGGQEVQMTVLQDKETWEKTNRWSDEVVDNWFKTELKAGGELGLGFTHEEALAKVMKQFISSYKDLPLYVYQIQTKFRNEIRAKAGLMRGREFLMKDLYSFSATKEQHEVFYEKMKDVYMSVFEKLGMGENTYVTISSGGSFSKYSYEFQTVCEAGEDEIYILDEEQKLAINLDDYSPEVLADFGIEVDESKLRKVKSVEVGDIYSLAYRFSEPFDLSFSNENGQRDLVYMGSYGMSPTRLMGTVVELNADEKGLMWPKQLAPFVVQLVTLDAKDETMQNRIEEVAAELYGELSESGVEVLWDDREGVSPGAKFADADLVGMPLRLVISERSLANGEVEWKERNSKEFSMMKVEEISEAVKNWINK
jgi:prolyl-tRNA synthetase